MSSVAKQEEPAQRKKHCELFFLINKLHCLFLKGKNLAKQGQYKTDKQNKHYCCFNIRIIKQNGKNLRKKSNGR